MGYLDDDLDNPYAPPKQRPVPLAEEVRVFEYAGFWRRFVAFVIDSFLIGFVAILVLSVLVGALSLTIADLRTMKAFSSVVRLAITVLYYGGMTSSASQATVGKMAMGLIVTDLRGRRLSFGRAVVRELAKTLSAIIFFIGFFMAAFTARKQALHDKIAGTLVLTVR